MLCHVSEYPETCLYLHPFVSAEPLILIPHRKRPPYWGRATLVLKVLYWWQQLFWLNSPMATLESGWARPPLRQATSFTTLRGAAPPTSQDAQTNYGQSIPSFVSFIKSTAPVPPLVTAVPPTPQHGRRSSSVYGRNLSSVAQNAFDIGEPGPTYSQSSSARNSTSRLPDRRAKTPPALDQDLYEPPRLIVATGSYPQRNESVGSTQYSPKTRSRGISPASYYMDRTPLKRSTSSLALDRTLPPPSEYDSLEFSPTADVFETSSQSSISSSRPAESPVLPPDLPLQGPLLPHELVAMSKQKRSWSGSQPSPRTKPSMPPSLAPSPLGIRSSSADRAASLADSPTDVVEAGYVSEGMASPFRARPRARVLSKVAAHGLSPQSPEPESPPGKSPWQLGELSPVIRPQKNYHPFGNVGGSDTYAETPQHHTFSSIPLITQETPLLESPTSSEPIVSPLNSQDLQLTLGLDSPTLPVSPASPKRPGLLSRLRSKRVKPPTSHPATPTPPLSQYASSVRTTADASSLDSMSRPASPYISPSPQLAAQQPYPQELQRLPLNNSDVNIDGIRSINRPADPGTRKAFFLRAAPSVLKHHHKQNKNSKDLRLKPADALPPPTVLSRPGAGVEVTKIMARGLAPPRAELGQWREGVRSVPDFSDLEDFDHKGVQRNSFDLPDMTEVKFNSEAKPLRQTSVETPVSPKNQNVMQISAPVPGTLTVGQPLDSPKAVENISKEDGRRERQRTELKKQIKIVGEADQTSNKKDREGKGGMRVFGGWNRKGRV